MKQIIAALLRRVPFVKGLSEQVNDLSKQVEGLGEQVKNLTEQVRKQGAFPAGHYYSPIPAEEDVLAYLKLRTPPTVGLPGMVLNENTQHELLKEYVNFYKDLPFPAKQTPGHRYYYENGWFSYSDAIFLYSFLRKHVPKRIIEVAPDFHLR